MDPTKPILDLYPDSVHHHHPKSTYRSVKTPTIAPKQVCPPPPKQISYNELKVKYQGLYRAYSEKVQRVGICEGELQSLQRENQKLKEQLYSSEGRNEQLNAKLLSKNGELEEAYRQLQEGLGGRGGRNEGSLNRLEEGLREAITSNFNLLREAALAELKQF